MGTRATLLIHDTDNDVTYQVYRTGDGYPDDVLPALRPNLFPENEHIEDCGRLVNAILKSDLLLFGERKQSSKYNTTVHCFTGSDVYAEVKFSFEFEGIVPFKGELHGDEEFTYELFVRNVLYGVEIFHIIVKGHGLTTSTLYEGAWHDDLVIEYDDDESEYTANHASTRLIEYGNLLIGKSTDAETGETSVSIHEVQVNIVPPNVPLAEDKRLEMYLTHECPFARSVARYLVHKPFSTRENIDKDNWFLNSSDAREGLIWLYLRGLAHVFDGGHFDLSDEGLQWYGEPPKPVK